jgi:hypothetical protein
MTWLREHPDSLCYYLAVETQQGTQDNDLGHSKNAKDWAIRRRVSKAAMIGYETVSETAKASVSCEGLISLRVLKVQSSPPWKHGGKPLGRFKFFKLMKNIWLLRVNHQKGLLVHQQLACCAGRVNGQHCQIAGNSRGNFSRELLLVRWEQGGHNYRLGTERSVLWHQGETRGYGKKVMNRDNPQPSPKSGRKTRHGCSSETQCQWAARLKIESVPTEMWSSRGTSRVCCYTRWESLKGGRT